MKGKPSVAIVGPGRLGTALAVYMAEAGYQVAELAYRDGSTASRTANKLARATKSQAVPISKARIDADVVWLTVGDSAIANMGHDLAQRKSWRGQVVLHASGALTSDELAPLRAKGAAVGAAHPMMTFVNAGWTRPFSGAYFAVEGDAKALRIARTIARDLGGRVISIEKGDKPLYHAFGAFLSPLLIAELATAEKIGIAAGVPKAKVREVMGPILTVTLGNYLINGAAAAFSGPLVRGDVETVRKNFAALKRVPGAQEVYRVLAESALNALPVKNAQAIRKVLRG